MSRSTEHELELAAQLRERLLSERRADAAAGRGWNHDLRTGIRALVDREAAILPEPQRGRLADLIERDTLGLGPLEELLSDPSVEEVMVNGHDEIYVERSGQIEPADLSFGSERELMNTIERILAPLGRRVDELSPMADARLEDGSRVNVVIPPLAVDGPTLSIRRFTAVRPGVEQLLEKGTLTVNGLDLISKAVTNRRSVIISGGTGSGKTTLLNAISSLIGERERVVTIEDAAELRLQQSHVVRLESRPESIEGRGAITIRDLLRNALRMRPDRIIIGEVRGGEALDLLTALNTGHDGALSTVHANSPEDAIRRLEVLALMAGVGLPHDAIREQLARGVDLVVHIERCQDGSRLVSSIGEVTRIGGAVGVRELLVDEDG